MSDHLCRLATGGGIRTHALFKDTDETLLGMARPIMLEGIANFVTRPDLMDRSIIFAAEPLSNRKTERVLHAEFEAAATPHLWRAARSAGNWHQATT
jgi:hypothetical protein